MAAGSVAVVVPRRASHRSPILHTDYECRRAWQGGPLRQWSSIREHSNQMPHSAGGYSGSYVCDGCLMPVVGVYRAIHRVQGQQSWLCASCRRHHGQ
jgi:hypothetical protein